ncbi:MAG TPA: methyltransferase domain-containing protein [Vicinamibacterales bacterium]|nr:methyltransferase domain-containing protein [Vicinamibacterales bacterium]
MRPRLLELLVCPECAGTLRLHADRREGDEVVEGRLACACGAEYPVVNAIPRVFRGAAREFEMAGDARSRASATGTAGAGGDAVEQVKQRTRRSFGYQWTTFREMHPEFERNFLNYVHPIDPGFFPGKLGLDAGCGFGRHIYYAARYGAEMVGVDYSAAIESARANTRDLPNVHLVQADIYRLPFRPGTFDFAYCLGVLHHLPDPLAGYRALARAVRPEGWLLVWLYSKTRRRLNAVLERVRRGTTRLPFGTLKALCFLAAAVDWAFFIWPYRVLRGTPLRGLAARAAFPRVKVYADYPFQVCYADWFDRLSAPIRHYYDEADLRGWASEVGLETIRITPTGAYGWRLQGQLPPSAGRSASPDQPAGGTSQRAEQVHGGRP